jgi:hypothetical protein
VSKVSTLREVLDPANTEAVGGLEEVGVVGAEDAAADEGVLGEWACLFVLSEYGQIDREGPSTTIARRRGPAPGSVRRRVHRGLLGEMLGRRSFRR